MTASELRKKFLDFFTERGHTVIPSASLIPENDPSVLFTTAGMHPLVPYLLGEPHPGGKRLVNVQKCVRTGDIEEVGDNRHLTFFEMLGNWSLGDYFKEDAIKWSWEFLTNEKWLNIDPGKLGVTIFGPTATEFDEESHKFWSSIGVPNDRIAGLGKDDNWWPAGGKHTGPQGPDTEIFYWTGEGVPTEFNPHDSRWVEIWNNVFMQYSLLADGSLVDLPKKNVDTGMGLERTLAILNGQKTVFETDLFVRILQSIERLTKGRHVYNPSEDEPHYSARYVGSMAGDVITEVGFGNLGVPQYEINKRFRIIADHIKAATFMLGDQKGVVPSNVDQGYILRRLIRRAVRFGYQLGIVDSFCDQVADAVIETYKDAYPELKENRDKIVKELQKEEEKFSRTLEKGMTELNRLESTGLVTGAQATALYTTYGFPLELTKEILSERGKEIEDIKAFEEEFKKHQDLSRSGSEKKFAGGLADHSAETTRLHTATHLLHRALKNVLGDHVAQKGSNITPERLRFDFTHPEKMSAEQLQEVAAQVNKAIHDDLPMRYVEMTTDEAKTSGAIGYFDDKYAQLGGKIKVYMAGDDDQGYFSKEICGGPHVTQTGELGHFSIVKEEAVAAGIRRIKATVTGPTAADVQKTSKNT